eukprot:6320996-Amphidinium_carterae.1
MKVLAHNPFLVALTGLIGPFQASQCLIALSLLAQCTMVNVCGQSISLVADTWHHNCRQRTNLTG